jgi:hypothetical protein
MEAPVETRIDEIAPRIYRLSTYVAAIAPPAGFSFNQFLIDADEPLLFHTGPRRMFPLVSAALSRIIPLGRLRWISFGHYEADECGAANEWLGVAPQAQIAHGLTGCMVSLNDMLDRAPRALADGELIDLGGRKLRYIDTPHVPHGWDAGLMYEETTETLFCGSSSISAIARPSPKATSSVRRCRRKTCSARPASARRPHRRSENSQNLRRAPSRSCMAPRSGEMLQRHCAISPAPTKRA